MLGLSTQSEYEPLAAHLDGEASEEGSSGIKLGRYDDDSHTSNSKWSFVLPKPLVYACIVVAVLSAINAALFPLTAVANKQKKLTEAEMAVLTWPDQRLGVDRVAKQPPPVWSHSWPTQIVRLTGKAKTGVYGNGVQFWVSPKDTTIMRFPVPASRSDSTSCAVSLALPPDLSPRIHDLRSSGDVSEIEVWSIVQKTDEDIVWDELSWNSRPPRGELLGMISAEQTHKDVMMRNSTTPEFACPEKELVVELRCMKPDCDVHFKQLHMVPKLAFELVRRN